MVAILDFWSKKKKNFVDRKSLIMLMTFLPIIDDRFGSISSRYVWEKCWSVKVSEWLLFNAKWAFSQLYHGQNKLHSMKWCRLCTRPPHLLGIFKLLALCDNSPQTESSLISSWCRAMQFLLLLHKVVCLAEKQQMSIS